MDDKKDKNQERVFIHPFTVGSSWRIRDRKIGDHNEKGIEVISRRPKSPAQHDKGAED